MVFNRFKVHILARLLLIFALAFLAFFIAFKTYFWLVSIWVFALILILIIEFVRFVDQSHRKLKEFILTIQQEDFVVNPNKLDKYHKELSEALLNIRDMITKFRVDAEVNFQYLQMVVNLVDVAIFCYDDNGHIKLINQTFYDLFDLKSITTINILKKNDPAFFKLIQEIEPGEKRLIKLNKKNQLKNLSLQKIKFIIQNQNYSLISIKDVQQELDYKEIESWQKLTSVLTHEIMNSAIPISNLTGMLRELLFDDDGRLKNVNNIEHYEVDDIQESIDVIQSRSKGLVNFVRSTRSITKIPDPILNDVSLDGIINHVLTLLKSRIEENNVELIIENHIEGHIVRVDEELIQQVLINLISNAIDAVSEEKSPLIKLTSQINGEKRVEILINDNGKGMSQEIIDKVFVPFFTTKKKGTGIGLSLSRQIMHLHRGYLYVSSQEEIGTTFTMKF